MSIIKIPRILMVVLSSIGILSNSLSAWYFLRYGNTNNYGGKLILTLTLSDTANCISHAIITALLFQDLGNETYVTAAGCFFIMYANAVTIALTCIRFLRITYPFMVISYSRFTYGSIALFITTIIPVLIYNIHIENSQQDDIKIRPVLCFMTLLGVSMIVVLVITVVTIRMYVVTTRGQQEGGNIEATLATRKRALATVVILNSIYVVTTIVIVIQLPFVIKLELYDILKLEDLTSPEVGVLYTSTLVSFLLPSVLRPFVHFTRNNGLKSYLYTLLNSFATRCCCG